MSTLTFDEAFKRMVAAEEELRRVRTKRYVVQAVALVVIAIAALLFAISYSTRDHTQVRCDNTNRVYERGENIAVIPDDPACGARQFG